MAKKKVGQKPAKGADESNVPSEGHNSFPEIWGRLRDAQDEIKSGKAEMDAGRAKINEGNSTVDAGRKHFLNGVSNFSLALLDLRTAAGDDDNKFHALLEEHGFGEKTLTANERSAYLNIARNLERARPILEASKRTSPVRLWQEIQTKLGLTGPVKANTTGNSDGKRRGDPLAAFDKIPKYERYEPRTLVAHAFNRWRALLGDADWKALLQVELETLADDSTT